MKKLLLFVALPLFFLGCGGNEGEAKKTPKIAKGKFHNSEIIFNNPRYITTRSGQPITGSAYGDGVNFELKNGKLHGKYQYFEGDRILDYNFSNGEEDGKFIVYENGIMKSEEHYVKGRKSGKKKEWIDGVLVSESSYKNGQLHGTSYKWDGSLKNLIEIRNYKNGYLDGVQINLSSKGDTLGIADLKNGTGEFRYKNEGQYSEYEYIQNYINGKLYGTSTTIKDGKIVFESNYKDNILEGTQTMYDEGGRTEYTKLYKNGIPNGAYIEYYASSGHTKVEGIYKNGRKHGKWKSYNDDDELIEETNYTNGYLHGKHKKWKNDWVNDNLYLALEENYNNGLKNGVSKEWESYPSRYLSSEKMFVNGQLEGKVKKWDDSDKLTLEENYKNGKLQGLSKKWDNDGLLISENEYDKGKLIRVIISNNED